MVELSQGSQQLSLHKPAEVGLARSRMAWVARPLGALGLAVWVLHPAISARPDVGTMMLLGFLLGAAYGLLLYGAKLRQYLVLKPMGGRLQSNRLPAEYYWGEISQTLFNNNTPSGAGR